MISEGSCDTEDDTEAFPSQIKLYIKIVIWK